MPQAPLKIQPGVNTTRTPTLLEAGFKSASLVRWREGLPEKIGGWQKFFASAVNGVPRVLHAWQDLSDVDRLAVATTQELAIIANSTKTTLTPQLFISDVAENFSTTSGDATVTIVDTNLTGSVTGYDVVHIKTPIAVGGLLLHGLYPITARIDTTSYTIEASSNAAGTVANGGAVPQFATTADSDRVTVTLAGHGLSVDDTFLVHFDVSVGGVMITKGVYDVLTVPTADTFTVVAPSTATSTASANLNGGNARLEYYIALGPDIVTGAGIGMVGFGALGQYALGDGSSSAGIALIQQTGDPLQSADWTLENWGEIMLACPCTQCDEDVAGIYYWQPGKGFQTMRLVPNAPLYNTGIFLSQPAQILVAYGSTANENIGYTHDHLLVRWSHQQDFTVWNATALNYAGSYRLPSGSRIVGGMSTRQRDLIWTDIELWSMNYLGGQGSSGGVSLVYGFQKIGTSCGLIGKHATVSFRGIVYWMGRSNFFVLGGNGAQVIPCTVWDAVFQDIDEDNLFKCWAQGNTAHNEVWFFYPSASGGTGNCDKYAKLDVVNGTWDHGPVSGTTPLPRSAGIDESVLGKPILASPSGVIYQHESGYDADGTPITWAWETGYFKLAEGQIMAFVDRIFPDFRYGTFNGAEDATIKITLKGANSPNETPREYGPYTVTQATDFISTRFRHRLMAIKVSGSDSASFSRLGQILFQYAPDGRR